MAVVQDITNSIALHIRDVGHSEITEAQLLSLVNDAASDADEQGWVLPIEDDESLTFSANTFEYAVPNSFSYISEIRVEDETTSPSSWDTEIKEHMWDLRIDGGVPMIYFSRRLSIPVDKDIKVIGQKRPTIYSAVGDTLDIGMRSFLRERAASFALSFMSAGTGELDRNRAAMSEVKFRNSQMLLINRHPQEHRVHPNAHSVPGR